MCSSSGRDETTGAGTEDFIAPLPAERIRVTILAAPVAETVPMSFGSLNGRQACLVEVESNGLVGIGESWINYPSWAMRERLGTLCDGIAPLILGRDVSCPVQVQEYLAERLLPIGRQWGAPGPIWQALSGIDLALWDLRGKALGTPVSELLTDSVRRGKVPVYASGIGPTGIAHLCESALRSGFTAVKTKVGFGEERDRAIVADARSAVGPDRYIFVDANQAWGLRQAVTMCQELSAYGVDWIEEPLEGDDLSELEKLAPRSRLPIATGENVYGERCFDRYIASAAVHMIQPDLTKAGGLSMGRMVAERVSGCRTRIAPHCYSSAVGMVASLHLGAAFPAVQWVEHDVRENPLRTELLSSPLELADGAALVPSGPGLGIELDAKAVRQYQTYREERTLRDG